LCLIHIKWRGISFCSVFHTLDNWHYIKFCMRHISDQRTWYVWMLTWLKMILHTKYNHVRPSQVSLLFYQRLTIYIAAKMFLHNTIKTQTKRLFLFGSRKWTRSINMIKYTHASEAPFCSALSLVLLVANFNKVYLPYMYILILFS
jgi:hypothetical protein